MTYCVAMHLQDGLIFASDSRTNAGVDHVATFRKMHIFEQEGERRIVLMNAGNLATTQSVVSLLRARLRSDRPHLLDVPSLYDAAILVGQTLKEVLARDSASGGMSSGVDFGASFLVGGQIRGEPPRLFQIYAQGNFIEASSDTPYFQIGESKYGKPILDRVLKWETPLSDAITCTLISFDSTIRSNLSVGMPIDVLWHHRDDFSARMPYRVNEDDPYFLGIRQAWGQGLRQLFSTLPNADWTLPPHRLSE